MVDGLARDRARLLELLTQLSFERRQVVLSSGKTSDFYIDCKRTALTAEGHFLAGRLLWDAIRRELPGARAVGGLTLGADPLASAVTPFNLRYLITKRDRLGHQIQDLDEAERAGVPAPAPLNGHAAAPHPAVIAAPRVFELPGSESA